MGDIKRRFDGDEEWQDHLWGVFVFRRGWVGWVAGVGVNHISTEWVRKLIFH